MDLDGPHPSLPANDIGFDFFAFAWSVIVAELSGFTLARSCLIRRSRSSQLDAYGLEFFVFNEFATSDAN